MTTPSPVLHSASGHNASHNNGAIDLFADQSLAAQLFPGCGGLSFGCVVATLAEHCDAFRDRLDAAEAVSAMSVVQLSATNGFTSRVFRCVLNMSGGGEPFTLIAKVLSVARIDDLVTNFMGEEAKKEFFDKFQGDQANGRAGGVQQQQGPKITDFFTRMHRNECNFYDCLAASAPIPVPRVYFTQQFEGGEGQGLILMEDLTQSAHLKHFGEGLNAKQAETVVAQLGRLHGHLMAREPGEWRKQFVHATEMFGDDEQDGMENWFEIMKNQMLEFNRDRIEGPLKRLRRVLGSMEFPKWAARFCREQLGIEDTLVHNDLWINNLLWRNAEPDSLAAIIDWQITSRGNSMIDVARLLVMNTSSELRRRLEKHILEHYLAALNGQLSLEGRGPVKYGIEQLTKAYQLAMVGQAMGCVMVVPFFNRVWSEEPDHEAKIARLFERSATALVDALDALEQVAPEWLEDEENGEAKE